MAGPIKLEDIARSDRLPSLPQVALRVIELAKQAEPDFSEVAETVRSDPALSAKILKTANSALLGLRQSVHSIEEALPQLGVNMVRTLVLSFTLARHDSKQHELDSALRKFWRSCLTQAVFAEQLAGVTPGADPATYFLAGLLQDIGVLSLLQELPDEYFSRVLEVSLYPDVVAAEQQCFGFTHVDVTRAICTRWGLSDEFIAAMSHHHDRVIPQSSAGVDMAVALQAANLATMWTESKNGGGFRVVGRLAQLLQDHYRLELEDVEDLMKETARRVDESAAMLQFDIGPGRSIDRILDTAKHVLEEVALLAQIESRARNEKLRDDSHRDAMTGVYNRRYMDELIYDRLANEIRRGKAIGLLFLDIDRFKSVNDEHGHQVGDEAIQHVARVLQAMVRRSDSVVRYGGDEFLVALARVTLDQLRKIAERFRAEVAAARLASKVDLRITTSVGALHYCPGKNDSPDANWLVQQVDQAMYDAKRNGGNQVKLYSLGS